MARRASSSLHPAIVIGAIIIVVITIIAGKSLIGKKSDSFGDVPKLAIHELLENGNSLRGNEYSIEGEIDEKLQWTIDRGQFISVKVTSPTGEEFVGIEIPNEFQKDNITTKQRYAFQVKFRQGGIAVATAVRPL